MQPVLHWRIILGSILWAARWISFAITESPRARLLNTLQSLTSNPHCTRVKPLRFYRACDNPHRSYLGELSGQLSSVVQPAPATSVRSCEVGQQQRVRVPQIEASLTSCCCSVMNRFHEISSGVHDLPGRVALRWRSCGTARIRPCPSPLGEGFPFLPNLYHEALRQILPCTSFLDLGFISVFRALLMTRARYNYVPSVLTNTTRARYMSPASVCGDDTVKDCTATLSSSPEKDFESRIRVVKNAGL
ncbi:hypothetical protein RRG08_007715 [Elysia crispata]|uniref:Uncharacterized protein n=1 Tax=Elysia crispata TaxID=231223 RepID=A0AAE1D0C5_9GAST|nr:hypothetical protein RRG08_007715 [Elysia crispata]